MAGRKTTTPGNESPIWPAHLKQAAKLQAQMRAEVSPPYADDVRRFATFACRVLRRLQERDAKAEAKWSGKDRSHRHRTARGRGLTRDQVRRIIVWMLRDCTDRRIVPPVALVRLVTYHLFPGNADPGQVRNYRSPPPKHSEKPAFRAAVDYELSHPGASSYEIAEAISRLRRRTGIHATEGTIRKFKKTAIWLKLFPPA